MTKKSVLASFAIAVFATPVFLGGCQLIEPQQHREDARTATESPKPHIESMSSLYEAARKEGDVFVMAFDPRDVNWMNAAFNEAFPGIRLHITSSLEHLPIIIGDVESSHPGIDVVLTSLMEGNALNDGGHLAPNDWTVFGVPANRIALDGKFSYTNNIVYTIAYDERRAGKNAHVAPNDPSKTNPIPATWSELLKPDYRGKLSSNPFVIARIAAGLGLSWGAAEAKRYAHELSENQDMIDQFGDARAYFLGESAPRVYYVGMASTVTEQWEKQGLGARYVVPEPVIMEQQGTAVLSTAPHPAAAKLLAGWLASEQGRNIRHREAQSSDLTSNSDDPLARELRARNVEIVYDTPETTGARAKLTKEVKPIFADNGPLLNLRLNLRKSADQPR
jgi:ABC-type Fe3+ transport system substrate-binding protein